MDILEVVKVCEDVPPALFPVQLLRRGAPEPGCITQALHERLMAMFFGDGERPRQSNFGQCAGAPATAWIVAARDAVSGFWSTHGEEAKARCAPMPLD